MIAVRRPFEVSIPTGFTAYSIIPHELKNRKKEKLCDAIHYFLDLLIPKPLERAKRRDLEETGFISLNAHCLKSIIGPEYKYVIELLEQKGVIWRDMHYIAGQKNRGYQITQEYFRETIKVEITNQGICERFWNNKKEEHNKRIAGLRRIKYITKWLDKKYVKIDVTGAHDFIETYRILMLKLLRETVFPSDEQKNEARCRVINRVFYQKHVVKMIDAGVFNPGRDSSGRLYSPIVSLKKELRSCVSINAEKIGSIDVKSSQPYLFQMLLHKEFWMTAPSERITLYNTYKERYDQLNSTGIRRRIIMILNNLETHNGVGLQEIPFKKILWDDDFYEYVRSLVQKSSPGNDVLKYFLDRGKVKRTVMLLLYDLYGQKSPPYYLEFKKHFPVEVTIMDLIKLHSLKGIFPTILQAVEAKLMLEKCCKRVNERYPTLPFLTVHDSLVCPVPFIENAKEILRNTMQEYVGSVPGLKVDLMDMELELQHIQQTVNKDWRDLLDGLGTSKIRPAWVSSFNEEPKEIPLQYRMVKVGGKIQLDRRMIDPDPRYDYWEDGDNVEEEYPDEYYRDRNKEYEDQE